MSLRHPVWREAACSRWTSAFSFSGVTNMGVFARSVFISVRTKASGSLQQSTSACFFGAANMWISKKCGICCPLRREVPCSRSTAPFDFLASLICQHYNWSMWNLLSTHTHTHTHTYTHTTTTWGFLQQIMLWMQGVVCVCVGVGVCVCLCVCVWSCCECSVDLGPNKEKPNEQSILTTRFFESSIPEIQSRFGKEELEILLILLVLKNQSLCGANDFTVLFSKILLEEMNCLFYSSSSGRSST